MHGMRCEDDLLRWGGGWLVGLGWVVCLAVYVYAVDDADDYARDNSGVASFWLCAWRNEDI